VRVTFHDVAVALAALVTTSLFATLAFFAKRSV